MRLSRIFTDQPLSPGCAVTLDKAASQHLLKVLRLKPGAELRLFNGLGGEYAATLLGESGKQAQVKISEFHDIDLESPLHIQLVIAISRGDRMDWAMQKATELGVTSIQPLFSERTEVQLKGDRLARKQQHWQQIVISACEQCGRNTIPVVSNVIKLSDWRPDPANLNFVLHFSQKSLQDYSQPAVQKVALLIGPEGGFTAAEIDRLINDGCQPLTLGPRVLRTETAPLAAISIVQSLWGDLSQPH